MVVAVYEQFSKIFFSQGTSLSLGSNALSFAVGIGITGIAFTIFKSCYQRPLIPPEIAANLDQIFDQIASSRLQDERKFRETLATCKQELSAKIEERELLQKHFEQQKLSYQQQLSAAAKENEDLTGAFRMQKEQLKAFEISYKALSDARKKEEASFAQCLQQKQEEHQKLTQEFNARLSALQQAKNFAEQCAKQQKQEKEREKTNAALHIKKYEALAQEIVCLKQELEERDKTKNELLLQIKNSKLLFDEQLQKSQEANERLTKQLTTSLLACTQQEHLARQKSEELIALQATLAKNQKLLIDIQTSRRPPSTSLSSSSASTTTAQSTSTVLEHQASTLGEKVILLPEEGTYYVSLPDRRGFLFYGSNNSEKLLSYLGAFENGKRHGKGKLEWRSGKIYEGDFANDLMQGEGVLEYMSEDKTTTYKGGFRDNNYHGEGVLHIQMKDGSSTHYEGGFQAGKFCGSGTFKRTRVAGDKEFVSTYTGIFEDGEMIACES